MDNTSETFIIRRSGIISLELCDKAVYRTIYHNQFTEVSEVIFVIEDRAFLRL